MRSQHQNLCHEIVPCLSWSPDQEEELVRLVGESIRQNRGKKYMRGIRAIDWSYIANQMNRRSISNACQLLPVQTKNKWDYLVNQLSMAPFEEEKEQSEINWYTEYSLKLKLRNKI